MSAEVIKVKIGFHEERIKLFSAPRELQSLIVKYYVFLCRKHYCFCLTTAPTTMIYSLIITKTFRWWDVIALFTIKVTVIINAEKGNFKMIQNSVSPKIYVHKLVFVYHEHFSS